MMNGVWIGWFICILTPSEYGVFGMFAVIVGGAVGIPIGYVLRRRSMAKLKSCGWCGEKLRPGESTTFDTRFKDAIFHAACLWGMCATKGWSFLQQPGGFAPPDLIIDCAADCHEYGAAGQGSLVLGKDSIWYERTDEYYQPYHPQCSPSKLPE